QLAQQKQQELQAAWQAIPQAVNDPSYQNTGPDGKPDGTLNTAKFQQLIAAKAPIFGAQYADQWLDAANAATENRSRILNLSNAQSQIVSDGLGAISQYQTNTGKPLTGPVLATLTSQLRSRLGNDPDANALIDHFLGALPSTGTLPSAQASATNQAYVGRAKALIDQTRSGQQPGQQPPAGGPQTPTAPAQGQPGAPPPQGAPQGAPGAAPSPLDQMRLSAQIGGSTATAPQYAPYTGPDSKTHYAQVNPNAPGGMVRDMGTSIPGGMTPSERYNVQPGPSGQLMLIDRQSGRAYPLSAGAVGAPGPASGAAPPAGPGVNRPGAPGAQGFIGRDASGRVLTSETDPNRPGMNAPGASWDAWKQSVQQAQGSVQGAREADAQYGNQMAIADQVRRLSSQTNTGPGTPEWNRTVGLLTSRLGGSQGVTNVQTLESFLDRQAASMREGMGLPQTNAGEEAARVIGGNVGMQGGALRAKNDYNEALAQGLHDYRTGLDHVEGFTGDASPSAVNRFKGQWAANYDPLAYEYKLAKERGDTAAVGAITNRLAPAQARTMLAHLRATDRLMQGVAP
ncbi:MAG: hypothetical protein WBE91_16345, partial [Steroidobacteraceae bacterium]